MAIMAGLLTMSIGCSLRGGTPPVASSPNISYQFKNLEGASWWSCSFKMVWPEHEEADFAIDLFLAHAVISPVISEFISDTPYWRFHRRAAHDDAGHRFTFLFYSNPDIASQIFTKINESSLLHIAIDGGLIEKVTMDDTDHPGSYEIESTSDNTWSIEIQKNWPSYIMGVSALWLGLINDSITTTPEDTEDIQDLLERYRKANKIVVGKWINEGHHAFLHHLSAIFGYQPMPIMIRF